MTLLMQGMRRSGTTIIYDALCQDPDLTCWYEPLAAAKKPAFGGGSGMQDADLFAALRPVREAFARARGVDFDLLNYGAPRDAALEFEETLPPIVRDWIDHLINRPEPVMAKFTRMYRKVEILADLAPGAAFIHLVRDPRAVAASYLFGRNQRNRHRFPDDDVYFTRRSNASAWSSRPFSDLVLAQPGWERYTGPTDLERILLIWRYTFEETRRRGLAAFGDRYLMVRHEDLCDDPERWIRAVYALDDRPVPAAVLNWAATSVRPATRPHAADDPRWNTAFDRLDLWPALNEAGYHESSAPTHDDSPRSVRTAAPRSAAALQRTMPRRLFLLTGMPRSGTTYLAAVLHDPPRTVTMSEARGAWKQAWRDGADGDHIADMIRTYHARILAGEELPTFEGTDGYAGVGRVDTWNQPKSPRAIPVNADAHIGLKNPEVFLEWLPRFVALGLRVVVTVRHPVGVVNSWIQRGRRRTQRGGEVTGTLANGDATTFTASAEDTLDRCIELHEHFASRIAAVRDEPGVCIVRYEEWFTDPGTLNRITQFLGLSGPTTLHPPPVAPDPPTALDPDMIDRVLRGCLGAAALGYPVVNGHLAPPPHLEIAQ